MTWDTVQEEVQPKSESGLVWSPYQLAVFEETLARVGHGKHLIVEACAGAAKTTTMIEMFRRLPEGMDVAMLAFNTHIAGELKVRAPEANARTYHSLGLATLLRTYPNIKIDADKVERFVKGRVPNTKWMIPSIKRLVSLCKSGTGFVFSSDDLEHIAFDHNIDLFDDRSNDAKYKIFDVVKGAIQFSMDNPEIVDFDDMIWLTNVLEGIDYYKLDFIGTDETQDTNNGQMQLVLNSVTPDGMILAVGDRNQSIYAFRGANHTAMDKMKQALDADELPLSISYRCPVKVKELVNKKFPHIRFEVPEWAKEGIVRDAKPDKVDMELQADDMVLCRVNADLIPVAFSLIRRGVKATVRGRDIGKGLISLIKKSRMNDVEDLVSWMGRWKDAEIMKAIRIGADDKIANITDRFDTLYAMTEDADTVAQVVERCTELFSDDRAGVVLSSIHKAKGLEANRVFILRPDLLPHPMAKRAEDIRQEVNIEYVATTRAKEELVFVR